MCFVSLLTQKKPTLISLVVPLQSLLTNAGHVSSVPVQENPAYHGAVGLEHHSY